MTHSMLVAGLQQYRLVAWWLTLAIVSTPKCSAQVRGTVELSPVVGIYFPTSGFQGGCFFGNGTPCPRKQRAAVASGGRVTAWIGKRLAVDASVEYSPSTQLDNLTVGNVRLLLGLIRSHVARWYLAGGPAVVSHSGTTSLGGVLGEGGHLRLGPRLAIWAEAEQYFCAYQPSPLVAAYPQWDHVLSLGLSVALGNTDRSHGETPGASPR